MFHRFYLFFIIRNLIWCLQLAKSCILFIPQSRIFLFCFCNVLCGNNIFNLSCKYSILVDVWLFFFYRRPLLKSIIPFFFWSKKPGRTDIKFYEFLMMHFSPVRPRYCTYTCRYTHIYIYSKKSLVATHFPLPPFLYSSRFLKACLYEIRFASNFSNSFLILLQLYKERLPFFC